MKNKRISVQICSRDRHTELTLCLQSLRTQTFQDWDLLIIDDASGTPLNQCHFFMSLLNRIKLENHRVEIIRNQISQGICYARNLAIDNDKFNNEYTFRCDDDVILEPNYLKKLLEGLEKYDLVTGIIPMLSMPEHFRETRFLGKIMNEHKLDNEGNLIENKDECAYSYDKDELVPTHQFRTNALYKTEITDKGIRYPSHLSFVGFREEGFFSFKCLLEGFKLAVRTRAVAYHLQTPSGGCRHNDYANSVKQDDESFRKWIKEKFKERGNFL